MVSPFGEHPTNATSIWRAEPNYRGSFGILSSCLTTMILCIWTAIHLNIPERGKKVKNFMIKVGWLTMGIFAPEIIVWTAFQQRRDSSELTKRVRRLLGQPPALTLGQRLRNAVLGLRTKILPGVTKDEEEESRWTDIQSFYVLMGGFVIPSPYATKGYICVKPEGVDYFLRGEQENESLAIRSSAQIEDKSKANNLAKAIVCLQVLWFCGQCVVRLAQGLPICLLELNTVAHGICAICIYLLWWDKPFDVEQPTLIPSRPDLRPIQAYTFMKSADGRSRRIGKRLFNSGSSSRERLRVDFAYVSKELIPRRHAKGVRVLNNGRRIEFAVQFYEQDGARVVTSTPNTCYLHNWQISIEASDSFVELTDQDLQILQEAHEAIDKEGADVLDAAFVTGVASNWPGWKSSNPGAILCAPIKYGSTSMLVGFAVAGFVYGLIHLLAWNAPFPTRAEQLLWRISGCVLAGSGIVIPLIELASSTIDGFGPRWTGLGLLFFMLVASPAFLSISVLYVVARLYLVVECFISLVHLPDDAFKVVMWSQYMPHMT